MGLHKKIYDVMCESVALDKSMVVGSGSFSYKAISESAVLNEIKPLLKKHKLILFPISASVTEVKDTYEGSKGTTTRLMSQVIASYKIVDIETGEFETLATVGNGADTQDKGSGKAWTYAYKSLLQKTFCLFSGEDTDNTHSDDISSQTTKQQKTEKDLVKEKIDCINALTENCKLAGFTLDAVIKKYNVDEKKSISTIEEMPVKMIVMYDQMMLISINKAKQGTK